MDQWITVILALIAGVVTLGGGYLVYLGKKLDAGQQAAKAEMRELKITVDGRLTQLLEERGSSQKEVGRAEGGADERLRGEGVAKDLLKDDRLRKGTH